MNWKWAWAGAMTTLVMGPWNFGMAQECPGPVIRAQDDVVYPESFHPIYHEGEVVYDDDYCEECEDDDCRCSPIDKIHDCWTYVFTLGGKTRGRAPRFPGPMGAAGPAGYGPYGAAGGLAGGGRDPRRLDYQYLYRYRAPQDLRYPAANQPAGVVVYPYYTVKGPDDFFLQETLAD